MSYDMNKSKSFSTVLFLLITFFIPLNAEDLINSGGSVYLAGDQYYDIVIITNGGERDQEYSMDESMKGEKVPF